MTTPFSLALRRGLARWLSPIQNSGNNNNQPPDLDELWRDFNQKLGQFFGGTKGKPTQAPRPPEGGGEPPKIIVIPVIPIVLGAAAVLWLASGTFMVQEGQQAPGRGWWALFSPGGEYGADSNGGQMNFP